MCIKTCYPDSSLDFEGGSRRTINILQAYFTNMFENPLGIMKAAYILRFFKKVELEIRDSSCIIYTNMKYIQNMCFHAIEHLLRS